MIRVTVKASNRVPRKQLNYNDRDDYHYIVCPFHLDLPDDFPGDPEEEALDVFHRNVAIKVLDDFVITTTVEENYNE